MTTREESLVLMDYLRHFHTLGESCREDAGGVFTHRPEACADEVAEYLAWERMLRVSGPVAEDAYFHIRRTAKQWWHEHHGQAHGAGLAERANSMAWALDQESLDDALATLESLHGIVLRPRTEQESKRERILGVLAIPRR
jgi:hypothetical protein